MVEVIVIYKNKRSQHQRPSNGYQGQFPCSFLLSRAGVHLHHQEDDIKGRQDIKDLEEGIVGIVPTACSEQVKVASNEDQSVQDLCEKGDPCAGAGQYELSDQ